MLGDHSCWHIYLLITFFSLSYVILLIKQQKNKMDSHLSVCSSSSSIAYGEQSHVLIPPGHSTAGQLMLVINLQWVIFSCLPCMFFIFRSACTAAPQFMFTLCWGVHTVLVRGYKQFAVKTRVRWGRRTPVIATAVLSLSADTQTPQQSSLVREWHWRSLAGHCGLWKLLWCLSCRGLHTAHMWSLWQEGQCHPEEEVQELRII